MCTYIYIEFVHPTHPPVTMDWNPPPPPPAKKKRITYGFTSTKDAEGYLILTGYETLPKNLWLEVLASNPLLSVSDIRKMCTASTEFNALCSTGVVWDRIFIKQFGNARFLEVRDATRGEASEGLSVERDALLRLLAARTEKYSGPIPTMENHQRWVKNNKMLVIYRAIINERLDNNGLLRSEWATMVLKVDTAGEETVFKQGFRLGKFSEIGFKFITDGPADAEYRRYDEDYLNTYLGNEAVAYQKKLTLALTVLYFWFMRNDYKYVSGAWSKVIDITVGELLLCVSCALPAIVFCGGCLTRTYCSKACAKADWSAGHSTTCN
jgi:hypothetical protein